MLYQLDIPPIRSHVDIPPTHRRAPVGLPQVCRKLSPLPPDDGTPMTH